MLLNDELYICRLESLVIEGNNGGWTCSIILIMNKCTQIQARVGRRNEQRAAGDNIQMWLMRGVEKSIK